MSETYPHFRLGAVNDIAPPSNAYADRNFASLVVNHADVTQFYTAWADKLTKDGSNRVSAIATEKASGGDAITIHSVNANPLYVPDAYALKPALEVARTVGAIPDTMRLPNGLPATGDFSVFWVLASTEGQPSTSRVMAGTGNANGRLIITSTGATTQARFGPSTNFTDLTWPAIDWANGLPHIFAVSVDRTNKECAFSVDGGAWLTAINASLVIDNLPFAWGARYDEGSGAGFNGRFFLWGEANAKALHLPGQATLWRNIRRMAADYLLLDHVITS